MAKRPTKPGPMDEPRTEAQLLVAGWKSRIEEYERVFAGWRKRSSAIIKRYRDERDVADDAIQTLPRYNVLWSNVQTLHPAIYARAPQPIVERRYLDKDFLGRVASMTLERALEFQVETGTYHTVMNMLVLDYLLPGRGTAWCRYEPVFEQPEMPEQATEDGEEEPGGYVSWEKVCVDYVHWSDFAHTPSRVWDDVWWIGRRIGFTREDGVKRFGEKFRVIPLREQNDKIKDIVDDDKDLPMLVFVWEIWDKSRGEVVFISMDYPDGPLEVKPDPLNLQGFWPTPRPLYATLTNESLVPVPDYAEYQDQAKEIDRLTERIAKLTQAIKVAGAYDASVPELQRIVLSTNDNIMVPVDSWAAFAEKGGVQGSLAFLPIQEVAAVLISLYDARDRTKQDLFEITGMSDIVRGQGNANETATAQRIKGQFASLRLEMRQADVARYARDLMAIMGEIISEQFQPETLLEMTGMLEQIKSMLPEQEMPQ